MIAFLILLQIASTLALVGLIWFVQVVHYPLFAKVGVDGFHEYERSHQQRTTRVVAPLMLTEAITSLALIWFRPAMIPTPLVVVGVLLVGLIWASTFFWQVPMHERLAKSFDIATHRQLVQSNWLRTVAWTARGVLVCWMCLQLVSQGNSVVAATRQPAIGRVTAEYEQDGPRGIAIAQPRQFNAQSMIVPLAVGDDLAAGAE